MRVLEVRRHTMRAIPGQFAYAASKWAVRGMTGNAAFELARMGIRVNAETLRQQLEITGQLDFLKFPYHRAIVGGDVPLSIGGGIGQSRTYMALLKKAHLGEVSVTVWPKILKEICAKKNIFVLE